MLYDKRWDAKVEQKAQEPSLAGLILWLEQQRPDTAYNWESVSGCLVYNYLRAVTGARKPSEKFIFSKVVGGRETYHAIAEIRPWTYGAALERARAALR